jgi:proline iminopeptidase
MLAVDYALAHPDRVAGLVLSSPCLSMRRVRDDMARLKAALPDAVKRVIARCEEEGTTNSGAYGAAAMAFYRRHVCRMPEWPEPLVRSRSQAGWSRQVYVTMWGPAEFTPDGNLAGYEREDRLRDLPRPVLATR